MRHKRTIFSNLPLGPLGPGPHMTSGGPRLDWILGALGEVPKLQDYPLQPNDFDETLLDSIELLRKRKMIEAQQRQFNAIATNAYRLPVMPPQPQCGMETIEYGPASGRQRRCFSCSELKPEASYNKNEKKKGVNARCISCVATNPENQDVIDLTIPYNRPNASGGLPDYKPANPDPNKQQPTV